MKIVFNIIALISIPIILHGQPTNLSYFPALKIAKATSLYKNDVNWDIVTDKYMELALSKSDNSKYEYLLDALNDKHGVFRNANTFQIIASNTQITPDNREFDSRFINEVLNDQNARFSHEKIESNIGYLRIVGIGPQYPMEEDSRLIQSAVAVLQDQGVDKWIVDLRFNGGGNMNPMLSGLSALLGKGYIGGSTDKSGEDLQRFEIINNQFYDTGNLVIPIENPIKHFIEDKVAVLLSKYTASSGEIVAVAFKGREHTKFFGEKTRGLTTVTGYDRIDDEVLMLISKAFYKDRLGIVYEQGVNPDIKIEFQEFVELPKDEMISQSVKWLKN